ncbi:hypothetical protein ACJX0J_008639 [Zea mays]
MTKTKTKTKKQPVQLQLGSSDTLTFSIDIPSFHLLFDSWFIRYMLLYFVLTILYSDFLLTIFIFCNISEYATFSANNHNKNWIQEIILQLKGALTSYNDPTIFTTELQSVALVTNSTCLKFIKDIRRQKDEICFLH